MKFCKDCKFKFLYSCRHEKSLLNIDLVFGSKCYRGCGVMRDFSEYCGENARYFDPSLFYKIKRCIWRKN